MRHRSFWSVSTVAVAFVVAAVGSGGAGAAPGDLDPTFGTTGQTTVPAPGFLPYNPRLTVDADGTIVGRAGRLTTADGTAVTSTLPQPPAGYFVYEASAGVQPDGRVVLVYLTNGTPSRVWVTRLLRSGAVDPSFATGFLSFGQFVPGNGALFVLPDGRTLVAHSISSGCVGVFRLSVLGTVDTTYGANGVATTCAITWPTELVAGGNDDVLLGGYQDARRGPDAVVAFHPDGSLDSAFATAGVLVMPDGTHVHSDPALTVRPDGKLLVIETSAAHLGVRRYLANGQPDNSFGTGGLASSGASVNTLGLVLRSDGHILAIGGDANGGPATAALFDPTGHLVTSFGTNGVATLAIQNGNSAVAHCLDRVVVDDVGSKVDQAVVARIQMPAPPSSAGVGGYVLDATGGLHAFALGTSGVAPAPACGPPALYTQYVAARAMAMLPDRSAVLTIDGWGGAHPSTSAGAAPGSITGTAYWPGWDIARGIAVAANNTGAYVLDGWGGLHPVGYGSIPVPPTPRTSAYWRGWDIARSVTLLPDSTGGYVLDGWGGLHPFATNGNPLPADAHATSYFPGSDLARAAAMLPDGSGGYVLDGWGGLHPFGVGTHAPPPMPNATSYWPGWDVARNVSLLPDGSGGYVLDAWGALHPFAIGAHLLPPSPTGGMFWTAGIARAAVIAP